MEAMRSPLPTPGRNRRFENLWQALSGFLRLNFIGSARPLASLPYRRGNRLLTQRERRNDLEIPIVPIRDAARAEVLIRLVHYCQTASTAICYIVGDTFSSSDGDDQGFAISEFEADGETPLDPEVLQICRDTIARCLPLTFAQRTVEEFISYGDAFWELAINRQATQVDGVQLLPTWEMFRIEDGELLGYEQRRSLSVQREDDRKFVPLKIIHTRYRPLGLYGRSIFSACPEIWVKLTKAETALTDAQMACGINPIVHEFPGEVDPEELESYKESVADERSDGIKTDYYPTNGVKLGQLFTSQPSLSGLKDTVNHWKSEIASASSVPPYLLGLPSIGAQQIMGAPERAYARKVNSIRGVFTESVVQLLSTELLLKGIPQERWKGKIRLVYPKIQVLASPGAVPDVDESEENGIVDTE